MPQVGGPVEDVMLLLFVSVTFFSLRLSLGCFGIAPSVVWGLFWMPVIVIMVSRGVLSILMVQLPLQWFLTLCETRSFVDIVENSQEVKGFSAFWSWSLFLLLAGVLFGLLVVSSALTKSMFSLVVQGVAVGSSVLFKVFEVVISEFPSALTVPFISP